MPDRPASGNPHRNQNLRWANRLARGAVAALLFALAAAALVRDPSIYLIVCALLAAAMALALLATAVIGYCPVHARVYPDRDPRASGLIAGLAPEVREPSTGSDEGKPT